MTNFLSTINIKNKINQTRVLQSTIMKNQQQIIISPPSLPSFFHQTKKILTKKNQKTKTKNKIFFFLPTKFRTTSPTSFNHVPHHQSQILPNFQSSFGCFLNTSKSYKKMKMVRRRTPHHHHHQQQLHTTTTSVSPRRHQPTITTTQHNPTTSIVNLPATINSTSNTSATNHQQRQPSTSTNRIINNNSNKKKYSEQELVEMVLLRQLKPNRPNSSQSPQRLPSPLNPISERISKLWATSTLTKRQGLWRRLAEFTNNNNLHHFPLGVQAALWINSLGHTTTATQYEYAKNIRALAKRMAIPTPLLDMFISTLQATGALEPTEQATPATKQQVKFLITSAIHAGDVILAVMVYLMYKSASRFDDVLHLVKESIIHHDPEQNLIIVRWEQTKTNRADPFRVSNWTVIKEADYTEMIDLTLQLFNRTPAKTSPFASVTYRAFLKFLKMFPETSDLTAHSIKRGAVGILIAKAAEGLFDYRLIPLLAKHKDPLHDFPVTTLRYAPNPIKMALVLGTQHATVHL